MNRTNSVVIDLFVMFKHNAKYTLFVLDPDNSCHSSMILIF